MQWYYAAGNQQVGPLSETEFEQLVSDGTVAANTLVWHEGITDWLPHAQLTGNATATEETAAEGAANTDTVTCCQCHGIFPAQDTIPYEDVHVCAECKPAFFQRLQEGAPPVMDGGEGRTPNIEIMAAARQTLDGNWGTAIGVCVVYWLITMAVAMVGSLLGAAVPLAGNVMQLLLIPPLTLGITTFFISFVRTDDADFGLLFSGFQRYGTSVLAGFLRNLVVGLCSLVAIIPAMALFIIGATKQSPMLIAPAVLLMIPGLGLAMIVAYMLAMTFFVLADDDTVTATDALKRSRLMMNGMKWKFFCLNLRFLGWGLLCMLTFGIGFLWLAPYITASYALFYHDVKGRTWVVQ